MATFETTAMAQQPRKRQRTSHQQHQQQIRRASRGTVATVVIVVVVTIFMIASLSHSAFFLVTTVTSFSTGHNNPLHRRKATTNKLLKAEQNDNEIAFSSSIVRDWIQTAIETTEAADTATTIQSENNSMFTKINTRFVLVDTNHPGNIGSSARSIKTMGFSPEGLVVVNPHDARVLGRKKCIDACSGARDVLEHAVLVVTEGESGNETDDENQNNETDDELETSKSSCLDRAMEQAFGEHRDGPILVCGTGMPVDMSHQRKSQRYLEPRKFFERLLEDAEGNSIDNSDNNSNSSNNNKTLNIAFVFGNERYGMNPEDMAFCDVVLGIPTHPSFGSLNLATAVQIIAYDWRQALGGFETTE